MVSWRLIQSIEYVNNVKKKVHSLVRKLNVQLKNERIINEVNVTRVKDFSNEMVTLSNLSKRRGNIKCIVEAKEMEINIFKSKLKIPKSELIKYK